MHRFTEVQADVRRDIAGAFDERDERGLQVPTSKQGFIKAMAVLMDRLGLTGYRDLLERPRVAIRTIGDQEKEPVEIINSFFLDDLYGVRGELAAGRGGETLAAYLGLRPPVGRRDVLADKALLEDLLSPALVPPARWPAPKPAKLVTLQQAGVNAALTDLEDGGLLSINGPPGTGKTTLLRDIVAGVIAARADALLEFETPAAAFSPVDVVAEGGYRRTLYRLDPRLRGHGMVVASSNNAAVRNVSAELPLAGMVAADLALSHFAGTADALLGREGGCWGLIAAVLGNRKNRSDFVETAWWDKDWGLEKYFAAALGQVKDPVPKIVEAERPPNQREAAERWRRARLEYRELRGRVLGLRAKREQVRSLLASGAADRQAIEEAERASRDAACDAEAAAETRRAAERALERADAAVADARRLVEGGEALRPGLIRRTFAGEAAWRRSQERYLEHLNQALATRTEAERQVREAAGRAESAVRRAETARSEVEAARRRLEPLAEIEARFDGTARDFLAGPAFWEGTHEAIHTASPWADPEFTAARDALFAASSTQRRQR